MIKLLGNRGAAAVGALLLTLVGGSSEAFGQQAVMTPAVVTTQAAAQPQAGSKEAIVAAIAREASTLRKAGWPL